MLFFFYITFTFFAVLNVVTGVFCQSAIEGAQHDQDMVVQQQLSNRNMYVRKLKKLFKDIDADESQYITYTEFEHHLKDEKVQAYFASLELDTSDAWELFKLLDQNETHVIDVEEFVLGCLRLKGNAKAIDIAKVTYENRMTRKKLTTIMESIESLLADILEEGDRQSVLAVRTRRKSNSRNYMDDMDMPPPDVDETGASKQLGMFRRESAFAHDMVNV